MLHYPSFSYGLKSFLCLCLLSGSLSCTKMPPLFGLSLNGRTLDHQFRQGTADDLYRRSDLIKRALAPPQKKGQSDPTGKVFEPSSQPMDEKTASSDSDSTERKNRLDTYPDLYQKSDNELEVIPLSALLKVRTLKSKGQKGTVSVAKEQIIIDPAISFINQYEFLDYEIVSEKTDWREMTAKLLGRVENFKGFPETEYYILPKEEGDYLILYKVASLKKIPYDELPLARALGDLLAVPLVGYPIENCLAEMIPDNNDRATGRYLPRCEGIRRAEYIRLRAKAKQLFEYEEKWDLFPRDFFSGQWFYHRTVVRSPEKREVGHPLFDSAHLVEFHPEPAVNLKKSEIKNFGRLNVLDASGGENMNKEDKISALFIPVEWADYRIKKDSENLDSSFSEEIITELYDPSLRYLKIRFKELVANQFPGYSGEKKLKSVFITDNYFSFNMEIAKSGGGAFLLKYAFRKKVADTGTKSYVEKQWFESDSALFFPSFAEERKYYDSELDHTQADRDRFLRTTRFNPKLKGIKWYFSKQTPHPDDSPELGWVRGLGREAVLLLNRAFEEAGKCPTKEDRNKKCSNNSIKIIPPPEEKSEDKEVGDIRYNILNLMFTENRQTSGLLGLGPNVADPTTGEVISATANVWVSDIISIYIRIVRRYIRFQVYPPVWKLNPKLRGVTPFLYEKIQKLCPEVSLFVRKNRNKRFDRKNPVLDDREIIKTCAGRIARPVVLGVILHEMLHGFASRHIFSASVDRENFYKSYDEMKALFGGDIFVDATESHPHPPQYSSVMDYMSFHHPYLSVPGKLDIAALRFIYFDHVELAGGGFLKVPSGVNEADPDRSQKSILQAIKAAGLKRKDLKPYEMLCGGKKEGGETDPNEPLCGRFDYGKSPLEILENSIVRTDNKLMAGRNRHDKKGFELTPETLSIAFIKQVGPLYKKWKKLRDNFLKQQSEKTSLFDFFFLDDNHIQEYESLIEAEALRNSDFESYYEIRQPVFDYMMKLIFVPLRHCVYKESNGTYSATALKNIKAELAADFSNYPEDSAEFMDCKSPVVRQWQKSHDRGRLVAEVGFMGEHFRKYLLRPKSNEVSDELSAFAMFGNLLHACEESNDFFDITQDPAFANRYYRKMLDYVFDGTDLNPYIDIQKTPDIPRDEIGYPNLPRVLSHKVDAATSAFPGQLKIYEWRQWPLHITVHLFKEQKHNLIIQREIERHFGAKRMELTNIAEFSESVEQGADDYESEHPFFKEIHPEYDPSVGTFAEFIIHKSSAVLDIKDRGFYIPYTTGGFSAQLFRQYNAFEKCLQKDKAEEEICYNRDEKEVFLKSVFNRYYQDKPEISPFEGCSPSVGGL